MNKKITLIAAGIIVIIAGILACLAVFHIPEKDADFIVGFDANFPPYGYMENGEYVGFDLDLAREVARRRGWKLKLKPINWDAKDNELNSGMIDCIWNGFTINGRENSYTWSSPYVINEQVVMVRKNSPIHKLADLKDRRVVVQTGTPVLKALQEGGECSTLGKSFKELRISENYESAVMDLESGAVDAVALDVGVANVKMKNGSFRILDEIVMKEMYGIGFRKGDFKLRDDVQNTLLEMVEDGTAAEISAKYFEGRNKMILGQMPSDISGEDVEPAPVNKKNDNFMDIVCQLSNGLLVSITIFFLTLIFAIPLGMVIASGRRSKFFIIRNFFRLFISVMRGTPLMLQLLVWCFGPYYLFNIRLSSLSIGYVNYSFIAVIIGFSLNYAAYFAEIYRAGIESISRGQYEAASVLGYSKWQTFYRIILPQVFKRILPPMTNEIITLVKDTSLAFSLSVLEMFTIAKQIANATSSMMPFIVAGIFYYIFNFLVAGTMAMIEKKLNYYR